MCFHTIRSRILASAVMMAVAVAPACREQEPPKKGQAASRPSSRSKKARPLDKPLAGIDKAVEEFTGAHTRIVWAEHQRLNEADTFANGNELLLKGLDTRDGKGERMLQNKTDNYSRPLLSSDGEVILFTDKEVKRKGGRKHYDPDIYRTDWQGSKPVRIAEGYAVDCWSDPSTGIEWVYAARDIAPTKSLSLEARRLVRFPLDDPAKEEVVYDDGRLSPDNIQFSRDGSHASGLFPWPNVGLLTRDDNGKYHARKLLTGCWPSLAPDNSGVSWVFDGGHRGATFFTADGKKSWTVKFNQGPGMSGHEMFHPRWTNHPQYLVVTGPYVPMKGASGNVINKGGASAEIHLGRFSEKLDKVEVWLQVTHDKLSESYPDVWIDGADEVQLAAFAPAAAGDKTKPQEAAWPTVKDGLVFLWSDRNAVNQFADANRRMHSSAPVEAHDAARFGRLEEMRVDGGYFQVEPDEGDPLLNAMQSNQEVTVEMVLLPDAPSAGQGALRYIFRGANLTIATADDGALIVAQDKVRLRTVAAMPAAPFHLLVIRRQAGFKVMVNGAPTSLTPDLAPLPDPSAESLTFGGGWAGGILGVAIHDRGLSPGEAQKHASAQIAMVADLPPAPPHVKVSARLAEASAMPSAEGIAPYRGALVAYVYEVEKVLEGTLNGKTMLVKHWAMLDQRTVVGFPREVGKSYELTLELESDHTHLKGERVMDDTTAFDLEAWFDAAPPQVQ